MTDKKPIALTAYETLAERYAAHVDHKPHNAYYERPAIRNLVPDVSGQRVLDAGCGPGGFSEWLVEQGAQAVGIDASPKMLSIARERMADNATFYLADLAQPLDFLESQSFDLVVASLVISYIEDLSSLFAELARLLKSGGLFIFSTHHPMDDFLRKGGIYFETTTMADTWRGFGGEPVHMPFYRRSLTSITEALWQAGFVIERLIEPLPTEEFRQTDPKHYDELMTCPAFICFRARLERA